MFSCNRKPYELQVGDVIVQTDWNRVVMLGIGAFRHQRFRSKIMIATHEGTVITMSREIAHALQEKGIIVVTNDLLQPRGLLIRSSNFLVESVPYGRRGWHVERSVVTWVVDTP